MALPANETGRLSGTTEDVLLLIGRLALGAIFAKSGLQKLFALGAFASLLSSRGLPDAALWAAIGATVEFVGGVLILTGFRTRIASLLMILFVIVATGISHRYWEFAEPARRLQESQFFKNLSIIGGFVLLLVTGSGRYGLDSALRRRKTRS